MTTSVSIPKLAPGQSVLDWGRIYSAATALLEEKQRIALLPIYVCRTAGETEIAHLAATKTTLEEAIKEIGLLIDGKRSRIHYTKEFFEVKPGDQSAQEITTTFFKLRALQEDAQIPPDVMFTRLLSFLNCGEKFYEENADMIIPQLTNDNMIALFKKLQSKLSSKKDTPKIKPEEEMYQYEEGECSNNTSAEGRGWYNEVKEDIDELKDMMKDLKAKDEAEEAYYYSKPKDQRQRKAKFCKICKKTNHTEDSCFKRQCFKCKGYGHNQKDCPSYFKKFRGGRTGHSS